MPRGLMLLPIGVLVKVGYLLCESATGVPRAAAEQLANPTLAASTPPQSREAANAVERPCCSAENALQVHSADGDAKVLLKMSSMHMVHVGELGSCVVIGCC